MTHYHIRWADSKIDWQAFPTTEEAVVEAERLKRRDENYSIEEYDGNCERCERLKAKHFRGREFSRGELLTSPLALTCPRCSAKPGRACIPIAGSIEAVHIERIKAATSQNDQTRKQSNT
ncbi:MAG: hypothetical protein DMG80_20855 [Acidobacteria bacterium]|jgi:hypothetical protein|nr:MAG: hypothetical protein DMG80_20855 [Acidobacteriota bacterium]